MLLRYSGPVPCSPRFEVNLILSITCTKSITALYEYKALVLLNDHWWSPIHFAVRYRIIFQFQYLLRIFLTMVNMTIAFGYEISFMAAQRNNMHLIKNTKKEFHIKFDSMCVMIFTVRVPVRIELSHFYITDCIQMSKCA